MGRISTYICGNGGPGDEFNPSKVTRQEHAHELLFLLNSEPMSVDELSSNLGIGADRVNNLLGDLSRINVVVERGGKWDIAFAVFSKLDVGLIAERTKIPASRLAKEIMSRGPEIDSRLSKLSCASQVEVKKLLFAVIGCFILDWKGLEVLNDKDLTLCGRKPQPGDRRYVLLGREEGAGEGMYDRMYWGSHSDDNNSRNKIRSLSFTKIPDDGTRGLDWLVGNSDANSFEELCRLFKETIKRIKSGEIKSLPYFGDDISYNELEVFLEATKDVYHSFYRDYWHLKEPSFLKRSKELESQLGSVGIVEKLENLSGVRYLHGGVEIYLLDEGGPAFVEGTRVFIPIDPDIPLERIEAATYIIAHELSHTLLYESRWREDDRIEKVLVGSEIKERVLGAIEECVVHYLGVLIALHYGTETGSCDVHRIVETTFLEKLPEFLHYKSRRIIDLLVAVAQDMETYQDPKLWDPKNFVRPYKIKVIYNPNSFPIDFRLTRERYT